MAAGKNIRSTCGLKNPPGLGDNFWICKKSEVTAIAAATDGVISGASAFTMATTPATGTFNVFEVTPVANKKSFTAPQEGELGSSGIWKPVLNGYINGMSGAKNAKLESFVGCPCIVIFQDKGKKRWLIGDLDDGVYIKVTPGINDTQNGYEIALESGGQGYIPYELNADVTLTVAADA